MRKRFFTRLTAIALSGIVSLSSLFVCPPEDVSAAQKENATVTATATEKAAWTYAIYMCGSDLESKDASASKDLIEMLQAKNMPEDVQIIIETGGSLKWFFTDAATQYYKEILNLSENEIAQLLPEEISSDYIQRYKINYYHEYTTDEHTTATGPALELLEEKVAINNPKAATSPDSAVSMGDSATLQDFLTYVKTEYPADHTALTLWNHGGGPASGVCYDYYASKYLKLDELQSALSGSRTQVTDKYDMISFDACLMSSYDVWSVLAPFADYGVGSVTLEPVDGWYYTPFLEDLGSHSTDDGYTGADLSSAIVDSYEEYYNEKGIYVDTYFNGDSGKTSEDGQAASLSAFDLKKVASTNAAFDNLADTLLYLSEDTDGMNEMLDIVYDTCVVEKDNEIIGLQTFLKETSEYAKKRAEQLQSALQFYEQNFRKKYLSYISQAQSLLDSLFTGRDAATIASYDGWEGNIHEAHMPMSLFFPVTSTPQYYDYDFISNKYPILNISSRYARLIYKIAAGIEKKQFNTIDTSLTWDSKKGSYLYSLGVAQAPYINGIGSEKYISKDGSYYLTERVDSKEPATYELTPDVSYTTLNGVPVFTEELHSTDDYTIYSLLCLVNGQEVTMYYIDFHSDEEKILYYYDPDEAIGGNEVENLKPGDVITPIAIKNDSVTYLNKKQRDEKAAALSDSSYTVKQKDILTEEDGTQYTILPLKQETAAKKDLNFAFDTMTNAFDSNYSIIQYSTAVNQQDILDFAGAEISLDGDRFEVTGDPVTPAVSVASGSKKYAEGKDYELIYENNLGKGTASVTISGLGQYQAVPKVTRTFTIVEAAPNTVTKEVVETEVVEKEVVKNVPQEVIREVEKVVPKEVVKEVKKTVTKVVTIPDAVKITSVKKKNKNVTVKYKKKKGSVKYQISYSTSKSGKKKILGSTGKTSFTTKKLNVKKKKSYYIFVRGYKTVNGKKYYGSWSCGKKLK